MKFTGMIPGLYLQEEWPVPPRVRAYTPTCLLDPDHPAPAALAGSRAAGGCLFPAPLSLQPRPRVPLSYSPDVLLAPFPAAVAISQVSQGTVPCPCNPASGCPRSQLHTLSQGASWAAGCYGHPGKPQPSLSTHSKPFLCCGKGHEMGRGC